MYLFTLFVNPGIRTVEDLGLQPLACWNFGFESRGWHEYEYCVFCQVELSVMSRSLVLKSPKECVCVSLSVIEKPRYCAGPGPQEAVEPLKKLSELPSPVAAPSQAFVWGRLVAVIVVSNSVGGMVVCVLRFVLSDRNFCVGLLTRPDLPNVVCLSVYMKPDI